MQKNGFFTSFLRYGHKWRVMGKCSGRLSFPLRGTNLVHTPTYLQQRKVQGLGVLSAQFFQKHRLEHTHEVERGNDAQQVLVFVHHGQGMELIGLEDA